MELDDSIVKGETKIARIKKFNIVKCALTYATVVGILTFCLLLLVALVGGVASSLVPTDEMFGAGIGMIGMVILGPILYFVITFVLSLIGFAIYNVASKWTGGFEVEIAS